MNKDEILEKSRSENKDQDVFDLDVQKTAAKIALLTTAILCCIVIIIKTLITKAVPYEFVMILSGMEAAIFITKYVKLHKKHELTVAILYSLTFLLTGTAWIMQLINV